jgi:hypothetical protein
MAGMTEPISGEVPYTEAMRALLQRGQQGDASVLPQLRELLNERPELWQRLGNLTGQVEEALLDLTAGKSLLAREAIRRRMEALRAELSVPPPTPVEKLLIDRVVICWAQCHLADLDDVQKTRAGTPQGSHAQRRLNGIQARFLAAVRQLVVVRRLLKPVLTPLELLRFSVEETNGKNKEKDARGGHSQPATCATR